MLEEENAFPSFTLLQVQNDLLKLYQQVACNQGRVQVLGSNGVCDCVLISKAELDALERALEILSSSDNVRELSDKVAQVADAVEPAVASSAS